MSGEMLDGEVVARQRIEADIRVYAEAGWTDRVVDALLHLADLVVKDRDTVLARQVIERLGTYRQSHSEAANAIERLEALLAEAGPLEERLEYEHYAAHLLETNGLIARLESTEYMAELERDAREKPGVACSLLHVLHRHGQQNLMDVLSFLSEDSGIPLLPLARFSPQVLAYQSVSEAFAALGALPFDFLQDSLMVAILQPYNERLMQRVRAEAGRPCLFYLVLPNDYDASLRALHRSC